MRNSSSLDWLRFMHTPNDYRVSPILLSIKYEQQKKLYSLPTTISHEAGMSRPEVEVQKKIIQTYSTDRN